MIFSHDWLWFIKSSLKRQARRSNRDSFEAGKSPSLLSVCFSVAEEELENLLDEDDTENSPKRKTETIPYKKYVNQNKYGNSIHSIYKYMFLMFPCNGGIYEVRSIIHYSDHRRRQWSTIHYIFHYSLFVFLAQKTGHFRLYFFLCGGGGHCYYYFLCSHDHAWQFFCVVYKKRACWEKLDISY